MTQRKAGLPLTAIDGMEKVVCRASAKVPIIKLWDPELELACDINVNNPLALDNTRMIKTYVQIDERVRPAAGAGEMRERRGRGRDGGGRREPELAGWRVAAARG